MDWSHGWHTDDYTGLGKFGARERGVGQKHSFCGCCVAAGTIVSIPQKACSALRGFEPTQP